jgi:hypothetical protein
MYDLQTIIAINAEKPKPVKKPEPDFLFINYGSVASIQAVSADAIAFAEDNFFVDGWQGVPTNFFTDWRPARDLAERLTDEGWRVE